MELIIAEGTYFGGAILIPFVIFKKSDVHLINSSHIPRGSTLIRAGELRASYGAVQQHRKVDKDLAKVSEVRFRVR